MTPVTDMPLEAAPHFWVVFVAIIAALLVFDLGFLSRREHEISARESTLLYFFYVGVAFAFGAWVWQVRGAEAGLEFFTAYLVEQSLAMDNMFVMAAVFDMLRIPRVHQRRVLVWGILGAIAFRAMLIGLGAALVHSFAWVLFIFGAFLILTGAKMLRRGRRERFDLPNNRLIAFLSRRFRITPELHGKRFIVRKRGKSGPRVFWLTPLAAALIVIEIVDLTFAVDSVPAVFAITQDIFIVYTSNIFAIMGLRALYFSLAAAIDQFRYLQMSLAIVLLLIGVKIILVPFGVKIDTWISLLLTLGVLSCGILFSLRAPRREEGP